MFLFLSFFLSFLFAVMLPLHSFDSERSQGGKTTSSDERRLSNLRRLILPSILSRAYPPNSDRVASGTIFSTFLHAERVAVFV